MRHTRIIAALMVLLLVMSAGVSLAAGHQPPSGIQRGRVLTVGNITELTGYFSTDMFGTNTTDLDIRLLLHGYQIARGQEKIIEYNRYANIYNDDEFNTVSGFNPTVVESAVTADNPDGSRTYTITLKRGLTYNDGTPITARDYVFSILMEASPEIIQVGGAPVRSDFIVGEDAYRDGETDRLSGLRLLSDWEYTVTVKPEDVVYFYDVERLSTVPYPISVIAPGCVVADYGDGAHIASAADASSYTGDGYTPGDFSAAMLLKTMLDPQYGYVFYPRVTSGPYQLESYDPITHIASFKVNERFAGDPNGQRPYIERVRFVHVTNEAMMDELQSGRIDLLNKVSKPSVTADGQSLDNTGWASYPRTGFGFLSFSCESGVASRQPVRAAIASLVDQEPFVAGIYSVDLWATAVYGYYGHGQWMYDYIREPYLTPDNSESTNALYIPPELKALDIPFSVDAAVDLLVADGWTVNARGEPYEAADGIRYRDTGMDVEPLQIKWAKLAGSAIADKIENTLRPLFDQVGIGLTVTEMDFSELMDHFYRDGDRDYNMFYLANNFYYQYDPIIEFNSGDIYQGHSNVTGLVDQELMELASAAIHSEPGAYELYLQRWFAFQRKFVELSPMVPLYTNVYYDIWRSDIIADSSYSVGRADSVSLLIPYTYLTE